MFFSVELSIQSVNDEEEENQVPDGKILYKKSHKFTEEWTYPLWYDVTPGMNVLFDSISIEKTRSQNKNAIFFKWNLCMI